MSTARCLHPTASCLRRVGDRHGRSADDWPLTEQTATEYFERFEPPTPEKGPLEVVHSAV